jgi:hypothetical protein
MPTYAVLGATGATGKQLTNILLQRPNDNLHIYARSESKLAKMFPDLQSYKHVSTFIGQVSDSSTLISCLSSADIIFSCIAQNDNKPGCAIAQEISQAIVKALEALRHKAREQHKEWNPPKVVHLAAMPLIPESQVPRPWLFYNFIYYSLYYIYRDHELAIPYLQSEGVKTDLLQLVIACPGGLGEVAPTGFTLGLTAESPGLSYVDLAGAMIQMSEEPRWVGQYVGIEGGKADMKVWAPVLLGNMVSLSLVFRRVAAN